MVWRKPQLRPAYLPKTVWKKHPRVFALQPACAGVSRSLVQPGQHAIGPKTYAAEELAALHAKRWRIELWFRDIKTSMRVEVLRCKSPKLVYKELELFLIAYNLIRCLMLKPAGVTR